MILSAYLRTLFRVDAAICLGMAAIVIPAAGTLAAPLGIGPDLLTAAGISLIPIGLFILWLGFRREAPAALPYLIVAGNIGWGLSSFLVAETTPGITALGAAAVIGQGAFVVLLAFLEWRATRAANVSMSAS